MQEETNNNKFLVGVHEAAHVIGSLLAYKYADILTLYYDQRDEEIPVAVTIVSNEHSSGAVTLKNIIENELINIAAAPIKRRGWHIFRLLAGYAAEQAYGLSTDFDTSNKIEDFLTIPPGINLPDHDLSKVRSILDQLIDLTSPNAILDVTYEDRNKIYCENTLLYWKITVDIFNKEIVKKATYNLANELKAKNTLVEAEIRALRELEFYSKGLPDCKVKLPDLNIKPESNNSSNEQLFFD